MAADHRLALRGDRPRPGHRCASRSTSGGAACHLRERHDRTCWLRTGEAGVHRIQTLVSGCVDGDEALQSFAEDARARLEAAGRGRLALHAAGGAMRGPGPVALRSRGAHRHLERQLAEGAAGPRGGVAAAARAGRPADAGDQAHRRDGAGDGLPDGRLPPHAPRRGPLERRGHRVEAAGHGRQLRLRRQRPGRGGRALRGRRRRRHPQHQRLRPQRARAGDAVLRGQAGLVRPAAGLAGGERRPDGAAGPRRRPQHRADRPGRLRPADVRRHHAHLAARARGVPAPAGLGPRGGLPRASTPSPAGSPGGTTAPATSTRASACASTTCW